MGGGEDFCFEFRGDEEAGISAKGEDFRVYGADLAEFLGPQKDAEDAGRLQADLVGDTSPFFLVDQQDSSLALGGEGDCFGLSEMKLP